MKKNTFISIVINNFKKFFNSNENPIEQAPNSMDNKTFFNHVDNHLFKTLNNKDKEGYTFTKEQLDYYSDKIFSLLKKDDHNMNFYKECKENNIYIPSFEFIDYYLRMVHIYINLNLDSKKELAFFNPFKELDNDLIKKSENKEFQKCLINVIHEICLEHNNRKDNGIVFTALKDAVDLTVDCSVFLGFLFPKCVDLLTLDDYLNIISTIDKSHKRLLKYGPSLVNKDIQNLLGVKSKIQKFADDNLYPELKPIEKTKKLNNETLNKISLTLIEDIENKGKECFKNYEFLSPEDQIVVKNIIEKHLPTLLNNYLSIPLKERDNLINHEGMNPTDILQKGLEDIVSILDAKINIINDILVSNLSVKGKHLNLIKKSI